MTTLIHLAIAYYIVTFIICLIEQIKHLKENYDLYGEYGYITVGDILVSLLICVFLGWVASPIIIIEYIYRLHILQIRVFSKKRHQMVEEKLK